MIWDVAAGVIIGGGALTLLFLGLIEAAKGNTVGYSEAAAFGYLMAAAGIAVGAWVIFFKAHFS